MKINKNEILPKIIWVAAKPPIPPFFGAILKSVEAIKIISTVTSVDVITFVDKENSADISSEFKKYWGGRNYSVKLYPVNYSKTINSFQAIAIKRFKTSVPIENSNLSEILNKLNWNSTDRLLILDDIILAPLCSRYGVNAILSPHDCISEMNWSHFRHSTLNITTFKYYIRFLLARYYEKSFYHFALLVHVVTHRDRIKLEKINPKARYCVVPIGGFFGVKFDKAEKCSYDIMVWANLGISTLAKGVKDFLHILKHKPKFLKNIKIIVVGRTSFAMAEKILGKELLSLVEYSPYLEDNKDKLIKAKIILIPDVGGQGIKNRCLSVLSSGECLACLYPQMEGIEQVCDKGAINASSMEELVKKIDLVLKKKMYHQISKVGQSIFNRYYNLESIRELWLEVIERAVQIRNFR